MMMVLLDEPTLILFESPDQPPDWLEAIDVLNDEYCFCDDNGQRFMGVVARRSGWLPPEEGYVLRPKGAADMTNVIALVERAVVVEPNRWFADVDSLRCYLEHRRGSGSHSPA